MVSVLMALVIVPFATASTPVAAASCADCVQLHDRHLHHIASSLPSADDVIRPSITRLTSTIDPSALR